MDPRYQYSSQDTRMWQVVQVSDESSDADADDHLQKYPQTRNQKSRGLSLSTLDPLSPMVTLQSLASDWPPNTVDSGYEPSPLSGDMRFTYSSDDIDFSSPRAGPNHGSASPVRYSCLSPDSLLQGYSKRTPDRNSAYYSGGDRVTPTVTRLPIMGGTTPPIAIPCSNNTTRHRQPTVSKELKKFGTFIAKTPVSNSNKTTNFANSNQTTRHSEIDATVRNLRADTNGDGCQTNNIGDSPNFAAFRRPRTNSCPESYRKTPTRPPVPLYGAYTAGFPKVAHWNQNTPDSSHPTSSTGFTPPGGIVHTRNWSTPATSGVDNRPHLVKPALPTVPLQAARSRDAIVDLSDDGPGHRRRVLVLALPDVVVDTNPGLRGVTGSPRGAPPHGGGAGSYQHMQNCSRGDSVPPLPPSTPEEARARRRAWTRPRALSCDVTMEETVGRALRHIADEFETGKRGSLNEPQTLLTRVRRSFSRILVGRGRGDDDEATTGATRRGGRGNRPSNGDDGTRPNESLYYCSSSEDSTWREEWPSRTYDLSFIEDIGGQPRYSLTRRGGGGGDDDEYFL